MIKKIKKLLPETHPLRLFYHKLWGILAAVWYRFPGNKLIVIGITGTDGKTTTATFVYEILKAAGFKVGLCTTVEFAIGDKRWKNHSHKTTLGRLELQKTLRKMVKAGCTHVVLETSSHAIKQNRVWGISYDIGLVNNITHEHLDYHQTFDDYRETKGKLLQQTSRSKRKGIKKTAILNKDDTSNYNYFNSYEIERKIIFSTKETSDVTAKNIKLSNKNSEFELNIKEKMMDIKLNLTGDFNIKNAIAASSIAFALDIPLTSIKKGLETVAYVPGRMEKVSTNEPFDVIIDFAMTPDGYKNILSFLKNIVENKLWIIFGCCGDRDKEKRPILGELTAQMCDKVIVTDDEPYSENPEVIRSMVENGIKKTNAKKDHDYFIIPDRKSAFKYAIKNAEKGDIIIIPGMGDLESITVGQKKIPWSDRKVLKEILKNR